MCGCALSAPCIIYLPQRHLVVTLVYRTLTDSPLHLLVTDAPKENSHHRVSAIQPIKLSLTQHLAHNDDVREGWGSVMTAEGCLVFSLSGSAGGQVLHPLWWCCWWLPAGSDVTDVGWRPLLLLHGCDSLLLHEYCFLGGEKYIFLLWECKTGITADPKTYSVCLTHRKNGGAWTQAAC